VTGPMDSPMRIAVVLDGTAGMAERQARALGGFLRDGLRLPAGGDAVTHLFFTEEAERESLTALAPTREVRLIRALPHRPDLLAAALTPFVAGGDVDLLLFAGGPTGTELAARMAARGGGSVLTGVLEAAATPGGLSCRRSVCSNHLTGRFELRPRPWCIGLDASWYDAPPSPSTAHVVQAVAEMRDAGRIVSGPLDDVELLEPPATGDLESARFLVVAGRGAGSRDGVKRIAAAAERMGAAFGVTRPVAMNAWAPADRQIGVSGVRSAPAVCLVAGASGAPAFMWGVERAGFIAAVDTDERAAIVAEADAAIVDDAVAVVEALADILARERG
jgi:electron transfer flavoprotein alpha subunit